MFGEREAETDRLVLTDSLIRTHREGKGCINAEGLKFDAFKPAAAED